MGNAISILGEQADYDPEQNLQRWVRRAIISIACLVLGIGFFGALIPIGGAIIGTGQIGVQSRIKRISHPTGGVIANIRVQNGDYARQGQELLSFDDRVSSTDAELASLTVAQLLAVKARLESEQQGARVIRFPEDLASRKLPGAGKAIADEQSLFEIRRKEAAGIAAQFAARITQYRKQIEGFEAQIDSLEKQRALIEPELEGIRSLWQRRLVTINRLNQIERTAVDLDGSIAALRATIAQSRAQIAEAEEQVIQVRQTRRSEAGRQLSDINNALNQQKLRSVSAEDIQGRTVVRAPYSGIVNKLAFVAVGDVIRPAETIMEIVPDRGGLIIEGSISPSDIDQTYVGQQARIRLTAFNLSKTPEFFPFIPFTHAKTALGTNGVHK